MSGVAHLAGRSQPGGAGGEGRRIRVLVVDDEPSIRLGLRALLRGAGYEAEAVEDAPQAEECLSAGGYDVVVTDVILPGASGVALMRRIRNRAPRLPVIVMTGEPCVETAVEAVRAGASDYLSKPVGKDAILRAVAAAVGGRPPDDECD